MWDEWIDWMNAYYLQTFSLLAWLLFHRSLQELDEATNEILFNAAHSDLDLVMNPSDGFVPLTTAYFRKNRIFYEIVFCKFVCSECLDLFRSFSLKSALQKCIQQVVKRKAKIWNLFIVKIIWLLA